MKKLALLALVVVPAMSQAWTPSLPKVVTARPKTFGIATLAVVGVVGSAMYYKGAARTPAAKPATRK